MTSLPRETPAPVVKDSLITDESNNPRETPAGAPAEQIMKLVQAYADEEVAFATMPGWASQNTAERQDDACLTAKQTVEDALRDYGALCDAADRAAEQAAGWISVDERLPSGWDSVLVYHPKYSVESAVYQLKDGGRDGRKAGRFYISDADDWMPVTHWMPMPLPPAPAAPQPAQEAP